MTLIVWTHTIPTRWWRQQLQTRSPFTIVTTLSLLYWGRDELRNGAWRSVDTISSTLDPTKGTSHSYSPVLSTAYAFLCWKLRFIIDSARVVTWLEVGVTLHKLCETDIYVESGSIGGPFIEAWSERLFTATPSMWQGSTAAACSFNPKLVPSWQLDVLTLKYCRCFFLWKWTVLRKQ